MRCTDLGILKYQISGHVSSCDIEEGRPKILAEETSIQRNYIAPGVHRIPLKVY